MIHTFFTGTKNIYKKLLHINIQIIHKNYEYHEHRNLSKQQKITPYLFIKAFKYVCMCIL